MFKVCLVVFSMLISFPVTVRKLFGKSNLREKWLLLGPNPRVQTSLAVRLMRQELGTAAPIASLSHSETAKHTECSRRVFAQFPFSIYAVRYSPQGMVPPIVDGSSHLSAMKTSPIDAVSIKFTVDSDLHIWYNHNAVFWQIVSIHFSMIQ